MMSFDRRDLLKGIAAATPLAMSPMRAFAQSDSQLFGMIEIGASGLKVSAYRIGREQIFEDDGKGPSGRERLAPRKQGESYEVNTNPLSGRPSDLDETVRVAAEALARLTQQYGVRPENIAIVASSGVATSPAALESLTTKLRASTGKLLDSISASEEAQLSYDWIVLRHRRQQVLLVDIGSGNTKGGYYENVGTPQQRFREFAVPLGTKTFGNAIRKTWPNDPVVTRAPSVFEGQFAPLLNTEIAAAPGLMNRPRVYFVGGIIWATALLVRPTDMAAKANWVRLGAGDFATLGKLIEARDPFKIAREAPISGEQRIRLDKQLTSVSETFSPDQLAAGNALCQGLSHQLDFSSRTALFFASFAVNAWSSQYLVRKFRGDASLEG